ncbi:hypothetical protein HDU98_002350, partial [Podochytrium sp. JEL0797]
MDSPSNAAILALLTRIAANQLRIESQSTATNSLLDARESSLSQHSHQTSFTLRQLSLQLLQLENPIKKLCTRFSNLPSEVACLILAWIFPEQVGLSRSFRD